MTSNPINKSEFKLDRLQTLKKNYTWATETVAYTFASYILMTKIPNMSDPEARKTAAENLLAQMNKKVKPSEIYIAFIEAVKAGKDPHVVAVG